MSGLVLRSPADNKANSVEVDRVRAYERGELDLGEVVVLAQDIYESGQLVNLPPRYFLLHLHCKQNGLIHTIDRPFH